MTAAAVITTATGSRVPLMLTVTLHNVNPEGSPHAQTSELKSPEREAPNQTPVAATSSHFVDAAGVRFHVRIRPGNTDTEHGHSSKDANETSRARVEAILCVPGALGTAHSDFDAQFRGLPAEFTVTINLIYDEAHFKFEVNYDG
jgi:hypothetical protein